MSGEVRGSFKNEWPRMGSGGVSAPPNFSLRIPNCIGAESICSLCVSRRKLVEHLKGKAMLRGAPGMHE